MKAERTHALLPWYANGTLGPEEEADFKRHLETCAPCREELEEFEVLRGEIARHGEAFFEEHPAPELLGALFGVGEGALDPAEEDRMRRHLAVCAACSEETRWLMGVEVAGSEAPAGAAEGDQRPSFRASQRRRGRPWASLLMPRLLPAAAAAALVLLGTILFPGPWRGTSARGPAARGFINATSRTSAVTEVVTEVTVRPEHKAIVLEFNSELTASQVPARIEIKDGAGRIVHRETGLRPAFGGAGAVFTIVVPRATLTAGLYSASLYGLDPQEHPTEFWFRIVTEAPGRT
jgi:anti-sigma factor RsiW